MKMSYEEPNLQSGWPRSEKTKAAMLAALQIGLYS